MSYLNAWARHSEQPGRQAAAAMRATVTAERRVMEEAHNLQSALARGDTAGAAASRAALRQAWETDVRRKGGYPQDFIPDLPHAQVVPVFPAFYGYGDVAKKKKKFQRLIGLLIILAVLFKMWK